MRGETDIWFFRLFSHLRDTSPRARPKHRVLSGRLRKTNQRGLLAHNNGNGNVRDMLESVVILLLLLVYLI